MLAFATTTNAQTTIAYVDAETLISDMAAYKKAQIDLETYTEQLEAQLKKEQDSFQADYAAVVDSIQKGIITQIQQKQAELRVQQQQQMLQLKAQQAQQQAAKKEAELFQPINDKFNAALKAVATENGYTYIVNKNMLLLSELGIDATEKVKAKLLQQ